MFGDLRTLLAQATPERSGDKLAGIAADGPVERLAAQIALADRPLKTYLEQALIPSEEDAVSDLIARRHDLTWASSNALPSPSGSSR